MNHRNIKQSIIRSQHCQRNWDLSKEIPKDDLDLLITAGTQCPSKQNIAFYRLHYVTNRNVIEEIHNNTKGFVVRLEPTPEYTTNTQTLANLLVIFEKYTDLNSADNSLRNDQTRAIASNSSDLEKSLKTLEKDRLLAVGVAAGYLNLTANMLGYSTGCCSCFDKDRVKDILNLENDVLLLMGIGFKNKDFNRRISHVDNSYMFPTKVKQPIEVKFIE